MNYLEMLELTEQTPLEQLGIEAPRNSVATSYEKWEAEDSLGVMTDPGARMSCRGIAGQIITPKHVEFSRKIEVIYPEEERFINQTDYSLSAVIGTSEEHTAEITAGWDDKKLIVAPALGIKNGHPEEFAFMLPGKGIIYDMKEEDRLKEIVEEQAYDIPPHIVPLGDRDILKALRHISLVIGDNKRAS